MLLSATSMLIWIHVAIYFEIPRKVKSLVSLLIMEVSDFSSRMKAAIESFIPSRKCHIQSQSFIGSHLTVQLL